MGESGSISSSDVAACGSYQLTPCDATGLVHSIPMSAQIGACVTHGSIACDLTDVSVVRQIRSRRPAFSAAGLSRLPPPVPFAGVPRRSSLWSFHPGSRVFQATLSSRLGSASPRMPTAPAPTSRARTRRRNSTGPHQTGMHIPRRGRSSRCSADRFWLDVRFSIGSPHSQAIIKRVTWRIPQS
jgi:hypothetical protein